ncbi:MAG: UDP-N-acetylglucosamine 2-epimerase, partial [Spirochaetes bacterium]|nr:UDP-N-acetylglucosamine 2-epimerase [Spirochaetota bacterium]
TAKLVGTDREIIVNETIKLLENKEHYENMAKAVNPYGDGNTSKRVVKCLH